MWEKNVDLYKPSYVWPNPAFHFREYYKSNKCRIFIIENIAHNWNWLKDYRHKFRENDHFFVSLGWYFDEHLVKECDHIFEILSLRKDRFHIMFNDFSDKTMFEFYGFQGEVINQNCFLDENLFKIIDAEKVYDAIYTARFAEFKRHYLASKIDNLALIAGHNSALSITQIPPHKYLNDRHLTPEEVNLKLSESKVGIILSAFEGACYSSSEYFLCGLPVVSTSSYGGRSIWYNDYNSITCESNPDAVDEAVKSLIYKNRDPQRIRTSHIHLSNYFRSKFIEYFQKILEESGDSIDVKKYFKENFIHKLLTSEIPNFREIFD